MPPNEHPPSEAHALAGRVDRRRSGVILVGLVLAVVIGWSWWDHTLRPETPPPRIPEISLEDVHPAVAAAIREARSGVQNNPESGAAWGRLGMVLKAHEYHSEAATCFRVASELDESDARWPYLLGDSLANGDPNDAEDAFRETARRKPDDALPLIRIAHLRLVHGRTEEALRVLRAAEKIQPDNARLAHLFARCHLAQGELTQALQQAHKARRLAPNVRPVHELCAQIEARMERHDDARNSLRAAQESPQSQQGWVDPYLLEVASFRGDPRWYAFRAGQLIDAGRVRDGVAILNRAIEQNPNNVMLAALLAQTLINTRNFAAADHLLRESLRKKPDSLHLLKLRGVLFLLRQDWEPAVKDLTRVAAIKPNDAGLQSDLGFCLKQLGETEKAIAAFDRALKIDPQLVGARVQLAKAYLESKQFDRARDHLQIVLQVDPDHKEAMSLLKQLPK